MKWPTLPLSRCVRLLGGGTPSKANPDYWSGDIPWVSPKDMAGREIFDTQDHITESAVLSSATQVVPAGSLLLVVRSGILARKLPVAITRVPVALNQDLKALVPKSDVIDSEYLTYYLDFMAADVLANCVKRGATVHSIDIDKLSTIEIPIPPVSEQQRIVNILDQADSLRKSRSEANALSDRILAAIFRKVFGEPATNPMGWPEYRIGDLFAETLYGTSARANDLRQGIAVVRMNNIDSEGRVDLKSLKYIELPESEITRLELRRGDILFNRTNSQELVGKTGLWVDRLKAVPASYLIRIRVRENLVLPEFVWAYMNTRFFKGLLLDMARRAIGMANINAIELRSLPAFLPPLERQRKFAGLVAEAIEVSRRQGKATESIERTFVAISGRSFSGLLTAKWRDSHLQQLLIETERQTKALALQDRVLQSSENL
jgi:type I restriction enzyme S subunit